MCPVYSKGGCATCKRRKKKCNEAKPICDSCMRMRLSCSYNSKRPRRGSPRVLSQMEVTGPMASTRAGLDVDDRVVSHMIESTLSFYEPMCDDSVKDLNVLSQLVCCDSLVRSSVVACFSVVQGSKPHFGQVDRQAYGEALTLMRSRIASDPHNRFDTPLFQISISMAFLGVMESSGPGDKNEPLRHFKALAAMLALVQPVNLDHLSLSEHNLILLVLESLAYHVTVAMYTTSMESIYNLWRSSQVFEILQKINPKGPERVSCSPLLSGQYMIYSMVLEVIYLHRLSAREIIDSDKIDLLEINILSLNRSVETDFGENNIHCSTSHFYVFGEIYRLFIGSLLICTKALREPTEHLGKEIDDMASMNLDRFVNIPFAQTCYDSVTWPLHILACATRHATDFQRAEPTISRIKMFLDPGHKRRLDSTLSKLSRLRRLSKEGSKIGQSTLKFLPPGLLLLKKENGILS